MDNYQTCLNQSRDMEQKFQMEVDNAQNAESQSFFNKLASEQRTISNQLSSKANTATNEQTNQANAELDNGQANA